MTGPTAALVDYGVGNMHSIRKALQRVGFDVHEVNGPSDLRDRDAIVLPGVGAFTPAATRLAPLRDAVAAALDDGRALLGVCLGMQLMYEASEEGPGDGLGLFPGTVKVLDHPRVPHIGWAPIEEATDPFVRPFAGRHVYYVHSYAPPAGGPEVVATSRYGAPFAGIVRRDRVVGTQFHPEKSSAVGLSILSRFKDLVEDRL